MQRAALLVWKEHAGFMRQQISGLQAAMLRWSKNSLAAAFAAWAEYAVDQVRPGLPWRTQTLAPE